MFVARLSTDHRGFRRYRRVLLLLLLLLLLLMSASPSLPFPSPVNDDVVSDPVIA